VTKNGKWLDVRLPSEHQNLSIEDSLNIPLYFIRLKISALDKNVPYVVYCDTGRRSSAAAYILVERGFDAYVLRGGHQRQRRAPPIFVAAPAGRYIVWVALSPESAPAR